MNKRTASTIMIFSIFALALFASCASSQQVKNSDIYIEDKGTAEGITVPQWVQISLTGNIRDIEKLPDYKGMNVAVVQFDAQDLAQAQVLADQMQIQTELAHNLSVRVKNVLRAAKAPGGDFKTYSIFSDLFVETVNGAIYTDFHKDAYWWVKVQTFTADGRSDKEQYRVAQLWKVDEKQLKKIFDQYLLDVEAKVPASPANTRAKNLVENTLYNEFFKGN